MRLIDEISRCPTVFDQLDENSLFALSSPRLRALVRMKNGTLALSGSLALIGCGLDVTSVMHLSRYKEWPARLDYDLRPQDEIFAADIFGDLLFVRDDIVFRLDGETGDHVLLDALDDFLKRPLSEIAEDLGGNLGRTHFSNRAIGADPLRLLPTFPFVMKQHVRGELFETPLTRAIDLKHRLFQACGDAPDGDGIDCAFWRAL